MKNNILCAGLVLSLCLIAVPVGIRSGANSGMGLHEAARSGDVDTVRWLLGAGASVDAVDSHGGMPLHLAAIGGHELIVQELLRAGASVDAVDEYIRTPLYLAVARGHEAVIRRLLNAGANVLRWQNGCPLLHVAAQNGCGAAVLLLLEAGAKTNVTTLNGMTALSFAAYRGHAIVVRHLLDAGANIDGVGVEVPLINAVEGNHAAVARLLLEAGADANAADWSRKTPLGLATRDSRGSIAQLLAMYGAAPLTRAAFERIISRSDVVEQQHVRARLEQLQPVTEQASLKRKHAIESTLDSVKVQSAGLPRVLQKLIISMSEDPVIIAWWEQINRLSTVSCMRLPYDLLEHIMTFDSPQDIGLFRRMLE